MPSTTDISPLSITDGKISNEARIAHAKLAKATEGQVLVAQPNGKFAAKSLAGDVTLDASGNTTSNVAVSSDGTTVVRGATGATGAKGGTGDQGATGATGPAGTAGTDGTNGTDGTDGSDATVTGTNVNAAGAVMHTDVPDSDTGFIKRTGAETYDVDTATYSTTSHAHGDIYYTETETDTLLATKSGTSHTHDDRYYTESEADTLLATKAASSHTHGDIYYTETETDTLLDTKAASSHSHTLEDVTDSGGAAALDVGTTTGTVCAGDDSRLSDDRDPTSHTHADATGSAAGFMPSADKTKLDGVEEGAEVNVLSDWDATTGDPVISNKPTLGGAAALDVWAGVGLPAGTVCAADDGRLADTRDPNSHEHAATDITSGTLDTDRLDVGASSGKVAAGDHTHSGYSASTHTHDGRYFQESEFLNASAGAGDAGKPVKLDAEGHIDTTMINDGDISFVDLDDIPTTFAPSAHTHAHSDLTGISNLQHIDWTATSPTPIHASNYTNTTYSAGNSGLVPAAGSAGQFLKHDASWGTPPDTTANETITLGGDVSGSGTTSIDCTVDDDSHNHAIGTITGVLNASAGVGSAGKLIKLDAAGHIDSTMINDGDISFVDLDDIPSTFAPSAHNHAATEITSGTLDTARLDVGASSGKVAAGDHTHSGYPTIDDSSALATDVWSASKIISYLASFYATLANGFSEHKFALEFVWGTDETGLVFTGSGASEYGILTHSLGSKDIVVSVRAVEDDDGTNNIAYEEDELADVGFDPFWIIANGANTCKIMQVADANVAGTWAITVIG
jgi:hypothetical protein